LGIVIILSLYSQEEEPEVNEMTADANAEEVSEASEPDKPENKKIDFTRKYFEIGLDAGAGFSNGFVKMSDIFRKDLVIDLEKLAQGSSDNGLGLNFGLSPGFFLNVKNIPIGKGIWEFGVLSGIEGYVNANISKSLLTLIAEGNINERDSSGHLGVSGGIFTEIGLKGSAKYEIAGRTLHIGVKPSIFTPAVYIPSNSRISYNLSTKKDDDEGIFVHAEGGINIYTPGSLEDIEPGRFVFGPSGFDLSLEGEYALFPFLDVGGSFSNIPFASAKLTNMMELGMEEFDIELFGEKLMAGEVLEIPEIEFKRTYYNSVELKVHRLLRFDVYARYKPFNSELFVLIPNIGFSVNVNKGDEKGYFNAGMEARLNLNNLFTFSMGFGCRETILRYKAGLGLNLRAFELDLEAAVREQTFGGSFMGRGIDINLGLRFGW
jgi:hypothetical protein